MQLLLETAVEMGNEVTPAGSRRRVQRPQNTLQERNKASAAVWVGYAVSYRMKNLGMEHWRNGAA